MPRLPHPTNRKSIPGQLPLYGEDFPLKQYCRNCGGRLRNPISIALGLGPTCLENLNSNRSQNHDDNGHETNEGEEAASSEELAGSDNLDKTRSGKRRPAHARLASAD